MKRVLAFILALVLMIGYLPVSSMHVHATEIEETVIEETVIEETTEPVAEVTKPAQESSEPDTEATESAEPDAEVVVSGQVTSVEAMEASTIPAGLYYGNYEGGMGIFGYGGNAATLVIPSVIDGQPVTHIANDAFYGCTSLKSITLPDTIEYIDYYAFSGCTGLTEIVIPDSVKEFGGYAFEGCTSLKEIVIPDSVTKLGLCMFAGCTSLESLTIPFVGEYKLTATEKFQYPLGSLFGFEETEGTVEVTQHMITTNFNGTYSTVTNYVPESLRSVTVTGGEVLAGAFEGFNMLQTLNLPATATQIPEYSFVGCSSLKSITVPDSVTSISEGAFGGCSALKSVNLPFVGARKHTEPDTYQYPLGYIFGTTNYYGTVATTQYYYGGNRYNHTSTKYYMPEFLTSVTIRGGYIPYGAFSFCYNLETVNYGSDVTGIDESVFYGCTALTYMPLPDGTTKIGKNMFNQCTSLTSATIPEGVTTIGDGAFVGCTKLTSVVIPDSVTSISGGVFSGCSALTSMTIPFVGLQKREATDTFRYPFGVLFGTKYYSNSSAIKQYYYGSSTSTTSNTTYYIPYSLTSVTVTGGELHHGAFYSCSMLKEVILGENVTAIGSSAFYGCTGLTAMELGDSIVSIGNYAFQGCSKMTQIKLGSGIQSMGSNVFSNCSQLNSLHLTDLTAYLNLPLSQYSSPTAANTKEKTVYLNGTELTELVVPEGITAIHNYAFSNCTGLMGVILPDSVGAIGSDAFKNCSKLTYVSLGNNLVTIDKNAFLYCENLWHVYANTTEEAFALNCTVSVNNTDLTNATWHYSSNSSALSKNEKTQCMTRSLYQCQICNLTYYDPGYVGAHTYVDGVCSVCGVVEGLVYTADSSGISITDYTGSATELTIPAEIEGIPVVAIGDFAFSDCSTLTKVTLPDGLKTIGEEAFRLSGITDMVVPDSVTTIKKGAFYGCYSLESITLPFVGETRKTTTDKYRYPFGYIFGSGSSGSGTTQYYYGSNGETNAIFAIPANLKHVTITGGEILHGAFSNCRYLESITLPSNITAIGQKAFYNCDGLKTIEIPDSVTKLGSYTFDDCTNLEMLELPEGLTLIGYGSFRKCTNLIYLSLPESLKQVESYVFDNATKLWHVAYAGTEEQWAVVTKGTYNYPLNDATIHCGADCSSIKAYTRKTCTTQAVYSCDICDAIFYDSTFTGTHTYEDGICSVCGASEYLQYKVKDNTVQITGYTGTATKVVIPETIEGIPVTEITTDVFEGNDTITSVTIADSVKTLGDHAFDSCTALEEVRLGKGLTEIPSYAFNECEKLTRIVIPEGITQVDNYAFDGCKQLSAITIPASVTTVGSYAFSGCDNLWHVFYGGSEEQWGEIPGRNGNSALTSATRHYHAAEALAIQNRTTCTIAPVYRCEICNSVCYDSTYTGTHIFEDAVCTVCGVPEGFDYSIEEDVITITKYTGTRTNLEIPATIEGYPVAAIGAYAFQNNSNLTRVTLPESIKTIGKYAFHTCSNLTDIRIPAGVTELPEYAFANCKKLCAVLIPESVTKIAYYAFYNSAVQHIFFTGTGEQWSTLPVPDYMRNVDSHTEVDAESLKILENTTCTVKALCQCDICKDFLFDKTFTGTHSFSGGVCSVCGVDENLKYTIQADGVYITGYVGSATELTVPATIEGYPVVEISSGAFRYCGTLTKITLPETVKTIGYEAFYSCSNLQSVNIPAAVSRISNSTFSQCKSLKSIELPGVSTIGSSVFQNCSSLQKIAFGKNISSIEGWTFSGCNALTEVYIEDISSWVMTVFSDSYDSNPLNYNNLPKKLYLNGNLVTKVEIPDGVTRIAGGAFANCGDIVSVSIPSTVETIGYGAFYKCAGLTDVVIPEGVKSIGGSAFYDCVDLATITLPTTITSIGSNAFYSCDVLVNVHLKDIAAWTNVEFSNDSSSPMVANSLSKNLYLNGELVLDLEIPDGVTTIPNYAFYYCTDLQSVKIPNTVTTIGNAAFGYCDNIESLTLGSNVQTIGNNAFYHCKKIAQLTLPDTLTTIGSYAFSNCHSIPQVVIPDSVKTMGNSAFSNNKNMTRLVIGRGMTEIPNTAFSSCGKLSDVTIPDTITAIGNSAFNSCSALRTLTIPGSVKSIGASAFGYCNALTEVVIPGSVTSIGESAFASCSKLVAVTIPGSVANLGEYAFRYCYSLNRVTFGDGVQSIGRYAFANCTALVSVVIPASMETISNYAFSNCTQLWHVLYKGDDGSWFDITISNDNESLKDAVRHCNARGDEITVIAEATCLTSMRCQCSICMETYSNPDYQTNHNYVEDICVVCGLMRYLNYRLENGKATITGYHGSAENVVIPAEIAGYPVVAIESYAFNGNSNLTSVTIPESVKSIGERAFEGCSGLTDVYYGGTSAQWKNLKNRPDASHVHTSTATPDGHWERRTVEATCTAAGYTCEVCACGYESEKVTTQEALGHTGGTATCKDPAICTRCETAYGEPDASNHTGETELRNIKNATCTEAGNTGDTHCAGCGAKLKSGETIAATGHSYSYQATTTPTKSAEGELTGTCANCDDPDVITLPALNEVDYTYTVVKEPTETEAGIGRYTWNVNLYGDYQFDVHLRRLGQIPGDIDGDESVNDEDVILLLWHTLLPDLYPIDADGDVNGDGNVNDEDVIMLLWHTLLPDLYPL